MNWAIQTKKKQFQEMPGLEKSAISGDPVVPLHWQEVTGNQEGGGYHDHDHDYHNTFMIITIIVISSWYHHDNHTYDQVGHVEQLYVYPVKSFAPVSRLINFF